MKAEEKIVKGPVVEKFEIRQGIGEGTSMLLETHDELYQAQPRCKALCQSIGSTVWVQCVTQEVVYKCDPV